MSEERISYGTSGESNDTSPMIRSLRIERPIQIEERNDPPMPHSFDTKVVYQSTKLPEWFAGLQSIVEDETFTSLVINLGNGKVRYLVSLADTSTARNPYQLSDSFIEAVTGDEE